MGTPALSGIRRLWKDHMHLRALAHSRPALALGIIISILIPVLTLPRLPQVSPWPVRARPAALDPRQVRALPAALACAHQRRPRTGAWYLRAYAESELLGLLTPGHVGADVWRMHRLTRAGLRRGDALASVGTDRLVGALGLAAFVVFAGAGLPWRMLAARDRPRGGSAGRPCWSSVGCAPTGCPPNRSPGPGSWPTASLLSAGYQLTIAGLLLGTLARHRPHPVPAGAARRVRRQPDRRRGPRPERRQPA